ncbi:MAG TPA: class I SAM-dependent methyltransferase [Vicinamibacteria bacterium]|nr:class I SAM-dependent methyltransferase [Vicinamibacteria bacterium]
MRCRSGKSLIPEVFGLDLLLATPHYVVERVKREQARRWCPLLSGQVLDIGCGHSPYLRFLGNATRYIGVEMETRYSPEVVASSSSLPFPDGSMDGVMLTEVLEHLPEPADALREARRVLRPGGWLYVTVPMTWGLHYQPHDYYRFTNWGIAYLLAKSGFEVHRTQRFGGLFTIISARLAALLSGLLLEPPLRWLGVERGRLRACALSLALFNLPAYYLSRALDRLGDEDALGWAVVARRE